MNRALAAVSLLSLVWALSACGGGGKARIPDKGPMPDGGTFTGVWYSAEYGEMHLMQSGDSVRGWFEKNERRGTIEGKATGNVLRFGFEDRREMVVGKPTITRGRGYFVYDIEVTEHGHDIHSLTGEWGQDGKETGGGPWTTTKARRGTPKAAPPRGD
jgi:hypothetical protein